MNFEVRIVGSEQAELIADYRFRMFADIEAGTDHSAQREEFVRAAAAHFRRHAHDPGQVLLVAFVGAGAGAHPVACAAMIITEKPPRLGGADNNAAYVHNVYVLPEYRKNGIAGALMRALHEIAIGQGVRRMSLHASKSGAPLYRALGYAAGERYLEFETDTEGPKPSPCYFSADIRIRDHETYARYLERVDEVGASFEGEYLAVDDSPLRLEGEREVGRAVLIRFPDEEALRRWYDSPEYRAILKHRLAAADCEAVVIHGKPR